MSQSLNDMIPDDIVDDLLNAVGTDNDVHNQAPVAFDGFGSQESLQEITSQDMRDMAQVMPSEAVPPSAYGLGIAELALPGVSHVPVSEPSPSNRMMPWGDLNLMIAEHGVHKRVPLPDGSKECAAHLNMHPPACVGAVVPIGNKPPTPPPCTSARARRAYRARLCLRAALSRAPLPR